MFRQNSQLIVDNLRQFRIRRIQGVTVHEKISQMGATEIAIIALSSVIFLGTVLAIALLCSSCKDRYARDLFNRSKILSTRLKNENDSHSSESSIPILLSSFKLH